MLTKTYTQKECIEIQNHIKSLENSKIKEFTEIFSYINQLESKSERIELSKKVGKVPTVLIYQSVLSAIDRELDKYMVA